MIRTLYIFIALLISTFAFSQQDPKWMERIEGDSLKQIDFLSLDYEFLNERFEIHIDSIEFTNALDKYEYDPSRINTYKDSLGLVLMLHFNNWQKQRIAKNHIGYTWLRQSYHTWQTPEEAEEFAAQFGIAHPWRMYEFLIDESNDDERIHAFYKGLITKVAKETGRTDLKQLSKKELLTVAMRCNPTRIDDFQKLKAQRAQQHEAYLKEHGNLEGARIGVDCGKANCCQKKAE